MELEKKVDKICKELEDIVQNAYLAGVTVPEAEKLAARCLTVRMVFSNLLKSVDLDSRMRKNGLKAAKSAAYMGEIQKHDKKPSDGFLDNIVTLDEEVKQAEQSFAEAEVLKDKIVSYLDIFKDAHIYFRSIAKGSYE